MKILFIASRFSYPPLRGDQVRAYHFLRILNLRHEVTLVAPKTKAVDSRLQEEGRRLCRRLVLVPFRKREALRSMMRFPFCHLPLQVLYYCPPIFAKTVRELLRREHFDLVHVQLARMAPAVATVRDVPKVIDFIDALSLNMRRRASLEPWPLSGLFGWEAGRMSRYEGELLTSFSQQVITSPADRAAIGDYKTLHVVPNGVNLEDFPYSEDGREPGCIVFTGRMGYFPNAEAAVYFATRVFPMVRKAEPGARFVKGLILTIAQLCLILLASLVLARAVRLGSALLRIGPRRACKVCGHDPA
ncbi:MAG: glycosyltransferase [Moorellales bacterium]